MQHLEGKKEIFNYRLEKEIPKGHVCRDFLFPTTTSGSPQDLQEQQNNNEPEVYQGLHSDLSSSGDLFGGN